jgi:hypothetical protein
VPDPDVPSTSKRPSSLVGRSAGASYFAAGWEIRITQRCLEEDLNADGDSSFDAVAGLEIVRALVRERSDKVTGGRQVNPISCGPDVWVVAHGNDHRGATVYDEFEEVVWLVSYHRHRSGEDRLLSVHPGARARPATAADRR